MLDSVETDLKTKANAIANLSYNLLGYFPAPFLYGIFRDVFDGGDPDKSTGGMAMLMWMTVVCAVLLIIAMCTRKIEDDVPAVAPSDDETQD